MTHFKRFSEALIELSTSDDYAECVKEWEYYDFDNSEDNCICNVAIIKRFHIRNKLNGNTCIVGSKCILKFMTNNTKIITVASSVDYNYKRIISDSHKRKCIECNHYSSSTANHVNHLCEGCSHPKENFILKNDEPTTQLSTVPTPLKTSLLKESRKPTEIEINYSEFRKKLLPVDVLKQQYKPFEYKKRIYFEYDKDNDSDICRKMFDSFKNIHYDTELKLYYFASHDINGMTYISLRNIPAHKF